MAGPSSACVHGRPGQGSMQQPGQSLCAADVQPVSTAPQSCRVGSVACWSTQHSNCAAATVPTSSSQELSSKRSRRNSSTSCLHRTLAYMAAAAKTSLLVRADALVADPSCLVVVGVHSRRDAAACQMYDELVATAAGSASRRTSSSSTVSPRPATSPLPWLYYVPGTPYLSAEDVDLE